MTVNDWIAKWSKPHWMPYDPRSIIKNLAPEHIGQLNLMWVMMDRAQITQGFFDQNLSKWELAGRISVQVVESIQVREYATVLDEREFYDFVRANAPLFSRYMPMSKWKLIFSTRSAKL